MAIAIHNPRTNQVRTIIREDHGGYRPPDGWELVPVERLPRGWTWEPPDDSAAVADAARRVEAASKILEEPREPDQLAWWALFREVLADVRSAGLRIRMDAELRAAARAHVCELASTRVEAVPVAEAPEGC